MEWPLTPSASSSDPRSRRAQQSSSEESTLGTFGVSSIPHRVGAPPLWTLPLSSSWGAARHQLGESTMEAILELVSTILSQHDVILPDYDVDRSGSGESLDLGFEIDDDYLGNISIVERSIPGHHGSGRLTVLIYAEWQDNSLGAWESAVTELKKRVDQDFPAFNLGIEIISTHLARRKYVGPVLGQPALQLQEHWPGIIDKVIETVQDNHQTPHSAITIIALCRLGFHSDSSRNSITVYVGLKYDCPDNTFAFITSALNQAFRRMLPLGVISCVEHNTYYPLAFNLQLPQTPNKMWRPDLPYLTGAHLGADISASKYDRDQHGNLKNPLFGTLGCFIEVKRNQNEPWIKLALTNYHVIRPLIPGFRIESTEDSRKILDPEDNTKLWIADRDGIRESNAFSGELGHPCHTRHNHVMAQLQSSIQQFDRELQVDRNDTIVQQEKARAEQNFQSKKHFCDSNQHLLGKLWAASGFNHVRNNHRMDWALIEVLAARQGTNCLPDRTVWTAYGRRAQMPLLPDGRGNLKTRQSSLTTMANGSKLWKHGASTGPTMGVYSGFRSHVGIAEAGYLGVSTKEHKFVSEFTFLCTGQGATNRGATDGLAGPGDSGAIAYDGEGHAIGLIFSGLSPQQVQNKAGRHSYTLVTPLEEVFEDIKAFLNYADIRIAQ